MDYFKYWPLNYYNILKKINDKGREKIYYDIDNDDIVYEDEIKNIMDNGKHRKSDTYFIFGKKDTINEVYTSLNKKEKIKIPKKILEDNDGNDDYTKSGLDKSRGVKIDKNYNEESRIVYYGETKCEGLVGNIKKCVNNAYYKLNEKYYCGVHSLKNKKEREELMKNPNKKAIEEKQLNEKQNTVDEIAKNNKEKNLRGKVICCKMKMRKKLEDIDGFLKVFPNFRHQNRKDGFGCMSLSPKAIGPINHNQKNLPPALNLENFHQSNKVFSCEVDENNNPLPIYYETKLKWYNDPIPHRHKYKSNDKNSNKPLYSIYLDKNGAEERFSYIESRVFYCSYYEQYALNLPDFKKLIDMLENGYNLQICGYDGFNVTDSLDKHYLDPSRPFGHELVLYTLLTISNPNDYPWRKHHKNLIEKYIEHV